VGPFHNVPSDALAELERSYAGAVPVLPPDRHALPPQAAFFT